MRIAVQADDGDELTISADFVSVEQAIVTLEFENGLYSEIAEFESITLTIAKARELADALLSVADAIEFVRKPVTDNLVGCGSSPCGDKRRVWRLRCPRVRPPASRVRWSLGRDVVSQNQARNLSKSVGMKFSLPKGPKRH